jgi:hypothetical protein
MVRDNNEEHDEEKTVNRRKFLERTGVAAGIGAFGVPTVEATERQGTLRYTEIGIEHRTELDERSWEEDYQSLVFTDRVGHYVDTERDLFHVLPFATDKERRLFEQSEQLVGVDGYSQFPVVDFRPQPTAELVTRVGSTLRPIEGLGLATPYAPPQFTVRETGNDVVVTSSSGRERVSPGSETVHQLSTQEVEVRTRTATSERASDEHVTDDSDETKRSSLVEFGTESLSFEPRIVVRNYGELDVMVASEPEHASEEA